jgi:hypothetical protein
MYPPRRTSNNRHKGDNIRGIDGYYNSEDFAKKTAVNTTSAVVRPDTPNDLRVMIHRDKTNFHAKTGNKVALET